jgi:hypothetical protein
VHLYDLSRAGCSYAALDTPAFSIDPKQKHEHEFVTHISMRMQPGYLGVLSISLGKGLCLYDIQDNSKVMHTYETHSVKTKCYKPNPYYLVVLTKHGTLELYDMRNSGGDPVQIYNEEY